MIGYRQAYHVPIHIERDGMEIEVTAVVERTGTNHYRNYMVYTVAADADGTAWELDSQDVEHAIEAADAVYCEAADIARESPEWEKPE